MMRLSTLLMLCCAAVTTPAVTGCAGTGPAVPLASAVVPPASHAKPLGWREAPKGARTGVYVAQADGAGNGIVFGYGRRNSHNGAPGCSAAGQSFEQTQIAVDRKGRVYVPDFSAGAVRIYAPHCGSLMQTVADPGGADIAVAVAGSTFYAAGGTHVAVCTAKNCTGNLTDASIFQLTSVAVDPSGNVWAAYYNQSFAPSLVVWTGGSMPGHVVSGYANPNAPGGLIFDRRGTLVSVETTFPYAFIYSCNAAAAMCTNTKTIQLFGNSSFGSLSANDGSIQITDYANNAVDVYAYPSFKYKYSYDTGLMTGFSVEGIAQAP